MSVDCVERCWDEQQATNSYRQSTSQQPTSSFHRASIQSKQTSSSFRLRVCRQAKPSPKAIDIVFQAMRNKTHTRTPLHQIHTYRLTLMVKHSGNRNTNLVSISALSRTLLRGATNASKHSWVLGCGLKNGNSKMFFKIQKQFEKHIKNQFLFFVISQNFWIWYFSNIKPHPNVHFDSGIVAFSGRVSTGSPVVHQLLLRHGESLLRFIGNWIATNVGTISETGCCSLTFFRFATIDEHDCWSGWDGVRLYCSYQLCGYREGGAPRGDWLTDFWQSTAGRPRVAQWNLTGNRPPNPRRHRDICVWNSFTRNNGKWIWN